MWNFCKEILLQYSGITSLIIVIGFIVFNKGLMNYITHKLKGEIDKDLEKFKALEARVDITNNRYVDVVTNQRIKWLELLRVNISSLIPKIKLCTYYSHITDQKIFNEKMISINESIIRLKLSLNKKDDKNLIELLINIEKVLEKIYNSYFYSDDEIKEEEEEVLVELIYEQVDKLQELSQKVLKEEWEKVKGEAQNGGKLNNQETST